MSFWSGPPRTPSLGTHFFEVLREVGGGGGGVKNVAKNDPPFFGSKIMNLLVFFDYEPKKCFRVPTPWGLYGAEWDERSCSLCIFSAIFAMLAVLATSVTLWYPVLRGASGDVVTAYAC